MLIEGTWSGRIDIRGNGQIHRFTNVVVTIVNMNAAGVDVVVDVVVFVHRGEKRYVKGKPQTGDLKTTQPEMQRNEQDARGLYALRDSFFRMKASKHSGF